MSLIVPEYMGKQYEIPKDLYERMQFQERSHLGSHGPSKFLKGALAMWVHLKEIDGVQKYLLKDEKIALLNQKHVLLGETYEATLKVQAKVESDLADALFVLKRIQQDLMPQEILPWGVPGAMGDFKDEHRHLLREFFDKFEEGKNMTEIRMSLSGVEFDVASLPEKSVGASEQYYMAKIRGFCTVYDLDRLIGLELLGGKIERIEKFAVSNQTNKPIMFVVRLPEEDNANG